MDREESKIMDHLNVESLEPEQIDSAISCTWDGECGVTDIYFDFSIYNFTGDESIAIGRAKVQLLDPLFVRGDMMNAAGCCSAEAVDSYEVFDKWRRMNKKKTALTAFLESIKVPGELRGHGLGSMCIKQILSWLERLHVKHAILVAQPFSGDTENMTPEQIKGTSHRLGRLYGKFGFKVLSEDEAGVIMHLPIKQRRST